jgi:hypothetical protein
VVVDVDLEKFFGRVNHDVLMDRLAKRVSDKAILRLIRRYLEAGGPVLLDSHNLNYSNRPVRTRMPGGVRAVNTDRPLSRLPFKYSPASCAKERWQDIYGALRNCAVTSPTSRAATAQTFARAGA